MAPDIKDAARPIAPRLATLSLLALWLSPGQAGAQSGVSAPVLMWQYGGCLSGPYCQTGWYSSPAVADLDGDGPPDVVWGAYDLVAVNGANGSLKWRAPSANRVWPGVVVADLTSDGTPEVVVGRDNDQLTVYDRFGGVVWTRNPFGTGEVRSLAAADLDDDGPLEIIVGQAADVAARQINVLTPEGSVRPGWPARHAGEPGFGGGIWNANVAVADINGDGLKEVVGPNGSHYLTALDRSGGQLTVNGIYAPRQFWSEVGVHVDHAVDLRGWANCGVEHRPDFSDSAAVIADVDGDGTAEMIVIGSVRNCGTNPYTDLYRMPFILESDRSRGSGSGFDWTAIPTPGSGSGPRSTSFTVIESTVPNAVVADLDGDGRKEILFPSYDGKVHAYWLDKTEHGQWPYVVPASGVSGDDFRFAGEPVVADLNGDGRAEVIFTSWPKKATGRVGQVHILGDQGSELHRIDLPAPAIGASWNGALGAPTIANIDSDPNLEVVVGTVASGLVAYKLPNTANARVLWGTGRGSYERTGAPAAPTVPPPDTTPPTASIVSPAPGSTVSGTLSVGANASDDVGVVGVQFRLDGVNLGAEDAASPYSVSWNITAATNGPHTLTAIARDAAGNATTSSGVAVTVDNLRPTVSINQGSGQADPTNASPIHFTTVFSEPVSGFTGADVTISGTAGGTRTVTVSGGPGTYDLAVSGMTSGTVIATLAAGVAADAVGNGSTASTSTDNVVTFNTTPPTVAVTSPAGGPNVSGTVPVAASASDDLGIAGVRFLVDGVALGAEDTTSPYSAAWDTTAMTDGSHALTAVARDVAGNTATSAPVTVTVSNAAPPSTSTRLENTDLSITYTDGITAPGRPAGWWHGSRSRAWSGKTASFNRSEGARARFAFTGTTVRWIGFRGPWAGIARVYMDDVFVEEVDLYATTEQVQVVVFSRTGLTSVTHTLTVESTGRKNAASGDWAVVVDAFEVAPASSIPRAGARVEETGLSLSADWAPDVLPTHAWSGAAATVSAIPGAQASFTFIGTEVQWIGLRGSQTGIARVFLDGSFHGEVDTFAPREAHAVVFMATGLAAGRHTLRIDVTGDRSAASTGAWIAVDALDVRGRVEDPDPSVAYTGDWARENFTRAWSGTSPNTGSGSAALSRTQGAQATISFTGTAVSWIGLRAPWTGTARVLVDGAFLSEVDTYATTEKAQDVLFTATGLTNGTHTLTVEATGQRNPASTDSLIVVDAFDLALSSSAPTITRHQEAGPATTYTGSWTQGTRLDLWSGMTSAYSAATGARATFTFTGTAVRWIGQRAFNGGIARVLLDGVEVARVDTFAPVQEDYQATLFSAADLPHASHTLTVEVTGQKNALAQGAYVYVDAFDLR